MCGTINFTEHYPVNSMRRKIWDAVFSGNAELLETIIDTKLAFKSTDKRWQQALKAACTSGHIEIVEMLIRRGVPIEAHDESHLLEAVKSGNIELIKLLIEAGLDINTKDSSGKTLLDHAIISANFDVVHYLINKGADSDIAITNIASPAFLSKITAIFKNELAEN